MTIRLDVDARIPDVICLSVASLPNTRRNHDVQTVGIPHTGRGEDVDKTPTIYVLPSHAETMQNQYDSYWNAATGDAWISHLVVLMSMLPITLMIMDNKAVIFIAYNTV